MIIIIISITIIITIIIMCAGAAAAATGSGFLVAARPSRLGHLPCGQRAVHEHWRPGQCQRAQ